MCANNTKMKEMRRIRTDIKAPRLQFEYSYCHRINRENPKKSFYGSVSFDRVNTLVSAENGFSSNQLCFYFQNEIKPPHFQMFKWSDQSSFHQNVFCLLKNWNSGRDDNNMLRTTSDPLSMEFIPNFQRYVQSYFPILKVQHTDDPFWWKYLCDHSIDCVWKMFSVFISNYAFDQHISSHKSNRKTLWMRSWNWLNAACTVLHSLALERFVPPLTGGSHVCR